MSSAPRATVTSANSLIFSDEPGGQGDASGGDAEQDDAGRVGTVECGLLDDLMGDPGDGPADVRVGHQFPVGARRVWGCAQVTLTSFSASLDGSLKDVELPRELNTRLRAVVLDTAGRHQRSAVRLPR